VGFSGLIRLLENISKDDRSSAYSSVSDRRRSHGACRSPLAAKSASTDASNQRTQLTAEPHYRNINVVSVFGFNEPKYRRTTKSKDLTIRFRYSRTGPFSAE
jgi:hypothetical protein